MTPLDDFLSRELEYFQKRSEKLSRQLQAAHGQIGALKMKLAIAKVGLNTAMKLTSEELERLVSS